MNELKECITRMQQHIESQDMEIYRQQRRIDTLQENLKKLVERFQVLEQGGSAPGSPADERPPHY
ncbi:MAG: SlyX family protein [Opitutales bacterium]